MTNLSSLIEQLAQFDSPTISNAIESFDIRDRTEGYTGMHIECQFPDLKPMVGFAVTCTMDTTTRGPRRGGRLDEFLELLAAAQKPSIVVIQDVGSDSGRSCFSGDLACASYQSLGAVGLVQDGGVRDLPGIRNACPNFHVFSPGSVVSHGNGARLELNVPVSIGGLSINPGDLLHGDLNGIVAIPREIIEPVIEQSEAVRNAEQAVLSKIKGGLDLEDLKSTLIGADLTNKQPRS